MDPNIIREVRRKKCASECRNLASWLLDRANLIDRELTNDENTLAILGKHIGRMKARVDRAGWSAEMEELIHNTTFEER